MSRRPVILLAFANPLLVPREYLPSLTRESAVVYQHLIPYEIEDRCNVDRIENATVDIIFDTVEAWVKRKDIILFHYGGHATSEALLFNTQGGGSRAAQATGLAKLLGSIDSLQLVFLNGCSTYGQVKLLLEQGVKAVIATSTPVNDQMAGDFADRFYKNLAEGESLQAAFEQARMFVETKYNFHVQKAEAFRSLFFETEAEPPAEKELPWGLYYKEEAAEVLNWRLPQQATQKGNLSMLDKYTCNRAEQNSRFKLNFLKSRGNKKFQYYIIHGEEQESPYGLFQRFVLEHISTAYQPYFYKAARLEEATSLEEAKINFLTALFQALELNPNRFTLDQLTLANLLKAPAAQDMQCIALKLRVYSSEWKPFTRDMIQWVLQEFSRESELPPDAPDLLMFISIIYDLQQASGGFFRRFFSKNPYEKLIKTLAEFPEMGLLPVLPPVKISDVNKWFDRITTDPEEKKQQIATYFDAQPEYHMVTVEKKLEQIIEVYNGA